MAREPAGVPVEEQPVAGAAAPARATTAATCVIFCMTADGIRARTYLPVRAGPDPPRPAPDAPRRCAPRPAAPHPAAPRGPGRCRPAPGRWQRVDLFTALYDPSWGMIAA